MNDHITAGDDLVAAGDPGEEFGHFVNATLLQKTRSFIIATLTKKKKLFGNRDEIMSQR